MIGYRSNEYNLRDLSETDAINVKRIVDENRVAIFEGQSLNEKELINFAKVFGEVGIYPQENYHHPDHPEIFVSANAPLDGVKMGVARTGGYWHIDTAFMPDPHIYTILQPKVLPKNPRSTLFADLVKGFSTLTDHEQELLRKYTAIHSGRWRYKVRDIDVGRDIEGILQEIDEIMPPVHHSAILQHPRLECESLYISSGFTIGLQSKEKAAQSELNLDELIEHVEASSNVTELFWSPGDIIVWDNRQVSHRSGRRLQDNPDAEQIEDETVVFRVTTFDGGRSLPPLRARPQAELAEA